MAFKQKRCKVSKHDRYVFELRDKIKHKYDFISTNVKVSGRKRSFGEIDIIARKGDIIDLYEVKCSHRIYKAKRQLDRAKKLLHLGGARGFFYCGSSGALVAV